jgi:acyl-homoserine lactone acylase PvdQ
MHQELPQKLTRRLNPRSWSRRVHILLAGATLLVAVTLAGLLLARHVVRRGWPQTGGTLSLPGLRAPVTVVRDRHGVPQLYAETEPDLFFAQGFVHAQDRFWAMELNRRRGRGTLTDLLGAATGSTDDAWRALSLADVARRELDAMDAAARAPLDAYAAGVNAWLETHPSPFEFTLLSWRGRAPADPAPWTPQDSLMLSLVAGWQMGVRRFDPSLAARVIDRVGLQPATFLLGEDLAAADLSAGLPLQLSGRPTDPWPQRWALGGRVTLVSADRTASGEPLLAVDLPTGLGLPAPWYLIAWHVGSERAAGASLPGLPGLLLGTDDAALWESWVETGELALTAEVPPWKRWLLTALTSGGERAHLQGDQAPPTVPELQALQTDTFSPRAARLIPLLVQLEPQGWRQERVTGMLLKWDYRVGQNNKESPFFAVYQLELARAAFADELGAQLFEAYVAQSDRYQAALDQILQDPDDEWWDDVTTPGRERRDDILKRAYEPTLEWIGRNYGDLHMLWEWDIVHGSRLHHPLGDAWPWDQLLNHDLYPDGWADTRNASPGGLPCLGGICQGGDLYRAKAVYGYRHIFDLADPATLWFTLLPGQSGHPFHPHYDDLLDEWLAGEYLPLRLAPTPNEVQEAKSVLILTPNE